MGSTRKFVPAAEVRTWALANIEAVEKFTTANQPKGTSDEKVAKAVAAATRGLTKGNKTATSRGRINPMVVGAFRKANPRLTYGETVAESPVVEQSYRALDKAGRKRTAKWTGTAAEARALYGKPGSKGRVDRKALTATLEADFIAAQPAPEPVSA